MKNSYFLGQTEVLSITGAVFVLNGLSTAGWSLITLGAVGAFFKFVMVFHAENQREEKKLLTESEQQIHEFIKRLTLSGQKNPPSKNIL